MISHAEMDRLPKNDTSRSAFSMEQRCEPRSILLRFPVSMPVAADTCCNVIPRRSLRERRGVLIVWGVAMDPHSALHADSLSSISAYSALFRTCPGRIINAMDKDEHPGPVAYSMRDALGLTLQQVVDALSAFPDQEGANTGNLSRFERAMEDFSLRKLERLATVYGVRVSDFFKRELPADGVVVARKFVNLDREKKHEVMKALLEASGRGETVAQARRTRPTETPSAPAVVVRGTGHGRTGSGHKRGGAR